MNKQYRAEIKVLQKDRHDVCLQWTAEIKRLGAEKRKLQSAISQVNRNSEKSVAKIDRRIAILRGRLS